MNIKLTENKKKILVLSCMVVLLVVAGTLSIVLNLNAGKANEGSNMDGTQSTFFSELQSNKELRKNEQIALLDAIINNDNSTKEAIANAEKEKLAIVTNIKTEMALESMIKAKGFDNVAVMIGNENAELYFIMPFKIIANQFYLSVIDTFIKKNKIAFTIYNYIIFKMNFSK